MWGKLLITMAALCVVTANVGEARATEVILQASFEYSGGTPPEGSSPWLTARFDDGGVPGSVTVTLEATSLTDNEFVSEWLLNVAAPFDPGDLSFSNMTKGGSSEFVAPTISLGQDQFKADGDGCFDILFTFGISDGSADRFTAGDSVSYTITAPSLTADSFNCLSAAANGGGMGPYPMAAHVQGIGPGNDLSGWVSTPEPACFALLALGSLVLMRRR